MNSTDRDILEHRFRISLEARNFEITQLGNRNSFFMVFQGVLLAGMAQASATAPPIIAFTTCAVGVVMSALQFGMASGAKFWQERWEHDLEAAEKAWITAVSGEVDKTIEAPQLFSLPVRQSELLVTDRLESPTSIPNLLIHRFSVSKIPIYAAAFFFFGWLTLMIFTFKTPAQSFLPRELSGFQSPASAACR